MVAWLLICYCYLSCSYFEKRYQCFNGVWSTPIKCCVDHWCWGIKATSHMHTHTCDAPSTQVYLCTCVCVWVCNLQLSVVSVCVGAGLRLESRCNFLCTKTPTSGTRGERSILQVQAALLPWTTESYRLSWPVTRHSPYVCVDVCVFVCWGRLRGVGAAPLCFFHGVKPLLGYRPVWGAAGQYYFTCSSWERRVCVGVCSLYSF